MNKINGNVKYLSSYFIRKSFETLPVWMTSRKWVAVELYINPKINPDTQWFDQISLTLSNNLNIAATLEKANIRMSAVASTHN